MDSPPAGDPTPGQGHKTYVFVDEYNRHKRLKVMRACDGCRKRKIRCDGALQNGPWPCGACVRLKLTCIPPTLDSEDDQQTPDSATSSSSTHFTFQTWSPTGSQQPGGSPSQPAAPHDWNLSGVGRGATAGTHGPTSAPNLRVESDTNFFSSSHLVGQQSGSRNEPVYSDDEWLASTPASARSQSNHMFMPSLVRTQTEASNVSGGDPHEVDATVKEVSEQMGDLSIDLTSVPAYITKEKQALAETPVIEEPDVHLPASVSTDPVIRIPPEMMPLEERALDYFGYFFDYIHPYVPVLHRERFYDQWQRERESISPLVLEGIFACVAQYLEDPIEVRRWLALAARHEESFRDVPRLSTVQGLLLLAKAKEAVPRRGYYYRSWMQVKYLTSMSMDLGMHEHLHSHSIGNSCELSRSDCMIYTRIWQTLLLLEVLIGGSQGRSDFAVDIDTVDFGLPTPSSDLSEFEYQTSRRTAYFAQLIGNIKRTNNMWQTLKKLKRDWALDAQFVQHNELISSWIQRLPPDMQIEYATSDDPPLLRGKHYVAYLHMYHHLVVLMHHRPQLVALLEKGDPSFSEHMTICNESAIIICKLQEALFRDFGLHGLQFMQRGIGFTIYCILTSTMLHLATITAPGSEINARARIFFTRHMRVLEHCTPSASPEIQLHVHTLREAFSQDVSKPFELKAGLVQRSPSQESTSAPTFREIKPQSLSVDRADRWSSLQDASSSRTLSNASDYSQPFEDIPAPANITFTSSTFAMPVPAPFAPVNLHQVTSAPAGAYTLEPVISHEHTSPVWDPSGIFSQWNAAFGQAQPPPPQPPPPLAPLPTSISPLSTQSPSTSYNSQSLRKLAPQPPLYPPPPPASHVVPAAPETVQGMPAVTPVMWHDAFSTAYASGHGRKRQREPSFDVNAFHQYQDRKG